MGINDRDYMRHPDKFGPGKKRRQREQLLARYLPVLFKWFIIVAVILIVIGIAASFFD